MDKEAVYNFLGNFFKWLSAHQGVAIIFIVLVLGIIAWLMLRARKYRRQVENEVYLKKKEIGKKDALIEEQESKLTDLQKKMEDLQGVASEAMLRTISTLTGYGADQLPVFFKSLARSGENPLHIADHQVISTAADHPVEGDGDNGDNGGINDSKERLASNEDGAADNSSQHGSDNEKLASGDDLPETDETTEKLESDDDALENSAAEKENGAAKEEVDPDRDASQEYDSKKNIDA